MPPVSTTCQSCADSKEYNDVLFQQALELIYYSQVSTLGKGMCISPDWTTIQWLRKGPIAALESQLNGLIVGRAGDGNSTVSSSKSLADSDVALEDIMSRNLLDMGTAEKYLTTFKSGLTPNFPFVVVPADASIDQLRQEKPVLCLAILASASYENMPLQRALGAEFKKVVASRMVVGGEISFELLQGLLVFLAWSHYHSRPHRFTQFLHLAISIVTDLRLDRPPRINEWKTALRFKPQDNLQHQTFNRPYWGSDEQRAVLGCYYLSSTIAMLVQKRSAVLRVPYHEECCKFLQEADEYPHDKYISYVIQLQFIAERIDQLSAKHVRDLENPGSGLELYVTDLKSDLEEFYRNLPFNINESPLLATQYHATGLCLYQLAVNINSQQSPSLLGSSSWRRDMSVSALVSASSIIDLLIQLPPGAEVGFNNTQWVQMGFALLVAYRHTVATSTPDQTVAFLNTLSELESRVGALSTSEVDSNGARDVFFDFRNRVIQIQKWLGGHNGQKYNSYRQESFQASQQTPADALRDTDGFVGAAQNFDTSLGDVFSLSAADLQIPQDFMFASPFEAMGDWM